MAYHSGSLTLPAGDPSVALMDVIRPLIAAHASWELVEQINPGAAAINNNTGPCDVFRNTAQGFAFVIRGYTAGGFYCLLGEDWDGTAKQLLRPTPPRNSASNAVLADGTWAAAKNWYENTIGLVTISVDATSTDWWLLVTNECIILATEIGSVSTTVYAGAFESLMTTDPYPFVLGDLSTNSSTSAVGGTWTRHPGRESAAADNQHFKCNGVGASQYHWTIPSGYVADRPDLFHGAPVGTRVACAGVGTVQTHGNLRGLYRHCLAFPVGSGVVPGDTLTINARTWVCVNLVQPYAIFIDTGAT